MFEGERCRRHFLEVGHADSVRNRPALAAPWLGKLR